MNSKLVKSLVTITTLATVSNADFLGAEVGFGVWNTKTTGDIRKGSDNISFEDDLGFNGNKANNYFYVLFDHPLPLIPNVKIQKTNFSTSANGKMTKVITFANQQFTLDESISSKLVLDQTDLILYYRVLDNWVNLDLGLTVRAIEGNINIKGTATIDESFDIIIPMIYTRGQFDLPFSGLSAEVDFNYIGYMGNTFLDLKAGLKYEFESDFGLTAGYRTQKLEIDDIDDIYGSVNNSGVYAGLFYHF